MKTIRKVRKVWMSDTDYSHGTIFDNNTGNRTVVCVSSNGITKSHHLFIDALNRAKFEAKEPYFKRVFIQGMNNICLQIK